MVIRDLLTRALAHHTRGELATAETLYHQVLQSHPNAFRAIEGLGVLVFQQGRFSEAAGLFARALTVRPESARTHANLGEALRLLGQTDRAVDHLHRAARLDPILAQVPNSLGLIAFDQGRRDEAEAAYREAIRLDPRLAAARINLANVHHARHREPEAAVELRLALEIEPDNRIALVTLGQVFCNIGDPDLLEEAETLCRRATALAPQFPPAFENLGNVLRARHRYPEALASYEQAAKLDPRRGLPHHYMGEHFQKLGNYDEAARCYTVARNLEPNEARFHADFGSLALARGHHEQAARHYRRAIECNPRMAEFQYGLGLAMLEQVQLDEAEVLFHQALRIDPFHAVSWCALARLQAERGDFDSSCRSAHSALEISPGLPDAFWRLASNLRRNLPEVDAQTMESLLATRSMTDGERALLHFGLALHFDARDLYSQAAIHLEKANALQRSSKAARGEIPDADRHSRFVDRTVATFTPDVIARSRGWGDPDPRPVFVVGLPRTGTTLVEQILASHPRVHGAGELQELHRLFLALPDLLGQPSADPFEALALLNAQSASTAARAYLDKLDTLAPRTTDRVVDKMPDNVRYLGLITMLWPAARVIVCTRDLRDVALSCWRTGFEKNPWANDWDDIARRFADNQRILDHWQHVLPAGSLIVRYEELVHNLERYARDLIDFLGLEWNPACLQFHETRRVVRTASLSQVREPLYTDSIGRWRRYEPSLKPMLDAFMRHGVRLD
jgi:tetratricopeptide (TPR) repeat protein